MESLSSELLVGLPELVQVAVAAVDAADGSVAVVVGLAHDSDSDVDSDVAADHIVAAGEADDFGVVVESS
jgi:hypothetical protein